MCAKLLFLDDLRIPADVPQYATLSKELQALYRKADWTIVRSFGQFKNYLEHHPIPDCISFDHDLGTEKSGYDCAKWLVEYIAGKKQPLPAILCHSLNPVGRENILGMFAAYKKSLL